MNKVAIRKWNYGSYSSDNYGAHSLAIAIGEVTLFFSYDTVIGFIAYPYGEVISENVWTVTTGKHLNWLQPDKSRRVSNEEFEEKLTQVLEKHNLA